VYEGAGEGVVSWSSGVSPPRSHRLWPSAGGSPAPEGRGHAPGQGVGAAVEAAEPRADSRRRSRGRLRRYVVSNRLSRLATFTYAEGVHDRARVVADWRGFSRRLEREVPGVVWARALELHPGGHGFHVHVALGGFIPKPLLARLWGHGFVDVRKVRSRRGGREDARTAAAYISKYVAKDPIAGPGEHSYEVRQGFQPVAVRAWFDSREAACSGLVRASGGRLSYRWDSDADPRWRGPPVVFAGWALVGHGVSAYGSSSGVPGVFGSAAPASSVEPSGLA
jgi:hypothetical protein